MSDRASEIVSVVEDPHVPGRIHAEIRITHVHPRWMLVLDLRKLDQRQAQNLRAGVARLMMDDRAGGIISELYASPSSVEIVVTSVDTGAGFEADSTADADYLQRVFEGAKIETVTDASGRVIGKTS